MHLLMSRFEQSGLSANYRVGGPTPGSSCPQVEVFLSAAWPQILPFSSDQGGKLKCWTAVIQINWLIDWSAAEKNNE